MDKRDACFGLALLLGSWAVHAADGLVAPAPEVLWPQWQARIAVQTASVSPLALSRLLDGNAARGVQGGAVLGDYYFAKPSFGSFRASGGLLMGAMGGTPWASMTAGSRVDLALNNGAALPLAAGAELPGTVPYLGLGFTGAPWRGALSITADLGMVAERPGAATGVGRAIFGSQALDGAVRELRLSPVFQLGVRYTF